VRNHSAVPRRQPQPGFVQSARVDELPHRPVDCRAPAQSHLRVEQSMINECWSSVDRLGSRVPEQPALSGSNGRRVRFGPLDPFSARLDLAGQDEVCKFFRSDPDKACSSTGLLVAV
jgi:hypothetical protein